MSSTSTKTQRKTIKPYRVIALAAASKLFVGCGGGAPVVADGQQVDTLPVAPAAVPAADARFPLAERTHDRRVADATHAAFTMALSDANPSVRMDAAFELGMAGAELDQALVFELLATAATDSNEHVRAAVVEAAVDGGGNEFAHDLLAYALLDPEPGVREVAIDGLLEIGGDESARILGTALADVDVSLREEVVYALGAIGGAVSASLLRKAAADPDPVVRQSADEQLARLGSATD
ncbi:MAG: HEAT repeat domain-containing protein [Gammaproteobacteria bacterium]|nr:HEAT repeat domain-containing protein [Gammaproteobacteria bacterium]